MVGGKIIGLARKKDETLVHVQDTRYSRNDMCSIRVVERRLDNGKPVELKVGDSIWWQSGEAMWTSQDQKRPLPSDRCAKDWDIHLRKVGYSH